MRFGWVVTAILMMILPPVIDVVMADEFPGVEISHPAWSGIESPVLIMLGCILVGLAGLVRKQLNKNSNRDHHVPSYLQQTN